MVGDGQSLNYAPFAVGDRCFFALLGDGLSSIRTAVTAISGTTYAQRNTTVATRVDQYAKASETTVIVDISGQSDLLADMTAAQLLSAAEAYADARRAAGFDIIVGCTVPDSTAYSAPQQAQRAAYNAALLASVKFDAVADLAAQTELSDASDTNYFTDGLHWTTAGALVARSVVLSELATLGIS